MRLSLLSALLLTGCASGPELWSISHDPAAGERLGDCALSTLVEPWSEVAEVYATGDTATVLLAGQALQGSATGRLLDVHLQVTETGSDIEVDRETRYQLDLAAGTGTAVDARYEQRAGTVIEDCVETVPLSLVRLD
ncbi:MAG: hypothetical protein KC912_09220 [Proteobacteria bacterium]|nr:hypothetical protein [Pseudomonadota bacterium]